MHTITHDPRAGLTPSQIATAKETIARRARFAARANGAPAFLPADKTVRPLPIPPPPQPIAVEAVGAFKKPWFWIEFEFEAELSIETIQKVVLTRYPGITRIDLNSERRTLNVTMPRAVAMYLARTLTPKSLPAIGRGFGDRDHTTVISAVRKIARLITINAVLAEEVAALTKILSDILRTNAPLVA